MDVRAYMRAFTKRRHVGFLNSIEERLSSLFSPSDWAFFLIVVFIGALSAGTLLATLSLSTAIEKPTRGGEYREGLIGNARFLNPLLAISETDRDLTQLLYSGLMKQEPGGSLSTDLAQSYEISEDKLTYTFVLKESARFHDGASVTAEDVAFTVRAAQNPEIKSPRRANWEGVVVTVIDERTISFTLSKPYAPFLENATMGILPSRIWNELSAEEFQFSALNAEPVGSGPFMIERVRRNDSGIPIEYTLKAFDSGARSPYIDRMIFTFYQNSDELIEALENSEIDAAHSLHPESVSRDIGVNNVAFGRVFGVFFNQNQNELFLDSTVREALDAGVDKDKIVSTIVGGYGSALSGPLPSDIVESALVTQEERVARAQEILTNDGWKVGDDGIFEKTVKKETKRLAFSLTTANAPELKQAAELVAEDWRKIGASVDLKFFEQNDLNVEVLRPRKYEALLFGLVVGREHDLFAFWHSSQRNDPGLNIALYANIEVDKLLDEARGEIDQSVREELIQQVTEEIKSDHAAVFLYAPHFVYLSPRAVMGISLDTITNPSDRFSSVEDWYLGSERVWPLFK